MIHPALLAAGIVQILCQFFKLVFYSLREKGLRWKYLVTAGGMPSAHSAFVSALTAALAVTEGTDSVALAISFVFSAIVIFDSLRLRAQVQELSVRVNRLVSEKPLPTMIGHSPAEVIVGVVLGLAGGAVLAKIFLIGSLHRL